MSENHNMNGKDFLIGTFVGAIIGASVALLFAPKSGRELRTDLSEGYYTASRKTQELARNVGEKSEYLVEKVKDFAGNVKEDIQKVRYGVNDVSTSTQDEAKEVTEEVAVSKELAGADENS